MGLGILCLVGHVRRSWGSEHWDGRHGVVLPVRMVLGAFKAGSSTSVYGWSYVPISIRTAAMIALRGREMGKAVSYATFIRHRSMMSAASTDLSQPYFVTPMVGYLAA